MTLIKFTIIIVTLFGCGILFASYNLWLEDKNPMNAWKAHLMQWSATGFGAIAFFAAGYYFKEDTIFSNIGVAGVIFIVAPAGYIWGRKLFKRKI